jgi:hypothetical protein
MNVTTLTNDIKRIVAGATNYVEHQPRISEYAQPVQDAPNTGVFRVVVMGLGKTKHAGLDRYADLAVAIAEPLSGGDANKTNEESAIRAERIVTALEAYDATEAHTDEIIDATLSRDAGRSIITIGARINYKFFEE